MGLFQKNKAEVRTGEIQFDDALLKALLGSGTVTKEMALQIPTVSAGIDLIANVIASTPIKLYKESGEQTEEIKKDPRLRLLNDETGDTLNANEFWRAITRDYFLGKGGYAFINREKGKIKSLHYVDEAQITIQKNSDPIFKDFDILVQDRSYKPFDFLKILRNTKDGAAGTPITQENSKLIEVAYESLLFERSLVQRGGNKKGFLKAEKKVDDASLTVLRRAFANLYSNQSDNMMVLNGGIDFKECSNTPTELQLNENKASNAEEFAKIFHVSTAMMSGKAADADTANLAKLAAIPLMTTIQCALNRDFLLEKEKGVFYWAFDTKELLKGDLESRFAAYKTALDANFMSIDEVRYLEDMPALGVNWLKLGLDSVLYDPDTKDIYTPNTNKLSTMGQQPSETDLKEELLPKQMTPDLMEPRANPNHDPKNGQFTNGKSSGGGIGGEKGLTSGGESGSLQSSPGAISATGANKFERGFSEKNLVRHVNKHRTKDYPNLTTEEYNQYALKLVQSKTTKDILGYKTADNAVVRYRISTNDFVKGYPKTGIATMYKPKNNAQKGFEYYKSQEKKEGIKDD